MDQGYKISDEPHDDYRPASAIRREIERTRADMDQTVREIRDKLSPGQLAEHAMDTLQDVIRKNGPMVWDAVSRNPLPVAVVAGGLGWLLYAGFGGGSTASQPRKQRASSLLKATGEPSGDMFEGEGFYTGEGYYAGEAMGSEPGSWSDPGGTWESAKSGIAESGSKAWSKAKNAAHTLKEKASETAHSLKETAAEKAGFAKEAAAEKAHTMRETGTGAIRGAAESLTHGIADTAGAVGHRVSGAVVTVSHGVTDMAGSIGHRTAEMARRTGGALSQGVSQTGQAFKNGYHNNPMAMGFLGIIAGCVLGMALPPTRTEVELMGDQADKLRERATRGADKAMNKAMEVGADAAHKVRETVGAKIEESQDRVLETLGGQTQTKRQTDSEKQSQAKGQTPPKAQPQPKGQSDSDLSDRDFGATESGKHPQHTQINPSQQEGGTGTSYHSGF